MNTGISDEKILEMIRNRVLVLSDDNGVLKFHSSYLRYVKLRVIYHWKSGRAQYAIRLKNVYRKIGANRLLWMLHTHENIPENMDIDHVDKNRYNDDISNLRPRDSQENQCDNISAKQLQEAMDFFDSVGFSASTCTGLK